MLKGIKNFAKEDNVHQDDVQILVHFHETLNYYKCLKFQATEKTNFKKILGTPVDILGYEKKTSPFLKQSLEKYKADFSAFTLHDIGIYLKIVNNAIWLDVYQKHELKKTISLNDHFESMGIK